MIPLQTFFWQPPDIWEKRLRLQQKHRRLGVMAGAALLLSSTAAVAASTVYMLQFGSFQSDEEAQKHLDELKNKHVGALSRLQSTVRPVTLPPDNLTVYRTQAGPLATRGDAQAVCAQLASNGDECYIVESALMPAGKAAAVAPRPAMAPAPSSASAAPAMPAATEDALPPASLPETASAAVANTPTAAVAGFSFVNRDAQNRADIDRVAGGTPSVKVTAASAPDAAASAGAEAAVRQALDEAAAKRNDTAEMTSASSTPHSRSFWDRINPFSTEEEKQAPAAVIPPGAAPVEPVISKPVTLPSPAPATVVAINPAPAAPMQEAALAQELVPPPPMMTVKAAEPMAEEKPANTASHEEREEAAADTASADAAPAVAMGAPVPLGTILPQSVVPTTESPLYPLPPPPAPLQGVTRVPTLAAAAAPAPAAPAVSPSAPTAIDSMVLPPPPQLPPSVQVPAPLPGRSFPMASNVRVEEAKRVPLTPPPLAPAPTAAPVSRVAAAPAPSAPIPAAVPVNLRPSSTLGQRTLWADIGQFDTAQSALMFWNNYRRAHPDFPVVRVRVTSPLAKKQRDVTLVSLRVGPFARAEFISNLCNSLTPEPGMHCGAIADLGVAINPYAPQAVGEQRYKR